MKKLRSKGKEREMFRAFTIKCHENALQLINDAKLLFHNKSYGHCFALLVLGFEEWAKSHLGFAFHIGLLKKTDHELQSLLKNHMWKQSVGLSLFFIILVNTLIEESEMKENYINLTQEFLAGNISAKRYEEKFRMFIQQDPSIISQNIAQFIDVIDEWTKNNRLLEDRKQEGLYVEYNVKNFSTTSPKDSFTRLAVENNLTTYEVMITSTNKLIEALIDRKKQNIYLKQLYIFGEQFRQAINS